MTWGLFTGIVAGLTVLACGGSAWAQSSSTRQPDPCNFEPERTRQSERSDRLAYQAIQDQLELLSQWSADTPADLQRLARVISEAGCLRRYYARYSGIQGNQVNLGSQGTIASSFGYLAAGGGAEAALGYGAFLPILLTQLSANEPKRDLYSVANVGVRRIVDRYSVLAQAGEALRNSAPTAGLAEQLAAACGRVRNVRGMAKANGMSDEDHLAIQTDAAALVVQCELIQARQTDIDVLMDDYAVLRPDLGRRAANDLLDFDQRVRAKHTELLYSPRESLGVMVATPFRAAANLLEGGATQNLAAQAAASETYLGLNLNLQPLSAALHRAPSLAPITPVILTERVRTASTGVFSTRARILTDALPVLNQSRQRLNRQQRLGQAIYEAVDRSQLTIAYSATSRIAEIALTPPTPAATSVPAAAPAAAVVP